MRLALILAIVSINSSKTLEAVRRAMSSSLCNFGAYGFASLRPIESEGAIFRATAESSAVDKDRKASIYF